MASKSNSACVQCTKVSRFSVQDAFRAYYMDISQDGCRLTLSGWNNNTKDTFIDLFALEHDPGFQDLSLLMTSQPYFSKEFTKIEYSPFSRWCACLLDDSVFVTCCINTIESYDTKNGYPLNRRQFTGTAYCMTATRDGRVYVGLVASDEVIAFDRRLNEIDKIKLKGLGEGRPWEMTVNNNKLFVISAYWRALMYDINGGNVEYEFKEPNHQFRGAMSITVSEENKLIYILWGDGRNKHVVVVYYLPGGHSSLHGDHSQLCGCHFLASFHVSDESLKTRVNNNVNRLLVVTRKTGEVYEYDTNDIINLKNLLTVIELLITKDNCQKLFNYFKVPAKEAETIQKSNVPSKTLLQHLRETGKISGMDISLLLTACNDQGISKVAEAWANYQKYGSHQKTLEKQSEDQRKHLSKKLTEAENNRQKLNDRLKEIQIEKEELARKLAAEEEQREQGSTKLRESEDERMQLGNHIEKAGGEKRERKDRFNRGEEERKELRERLTVLNEEHQQLIHSFRTVEKDKKQITVELTETNYEKQQLMWRIEMTEKEPRQMKIMLKGQERQEQQLTNKLELTEKEKKVLISRLKESDGERQQLTGRLETTEEERRQLGERLNAMVKEEQHVTTRQRTIEEENKKTDK